jgi:hypothetical protein
MKRRSRRIRLEQIVLLIVRTLLVILLVLAIAEPRMEGGRLVFSKGTRTHRVLVIDGSYSMAYRPDKAAGIEDTAGKTRFEHAKELALKIVDQSAQGDAFTLVLMAAPPRVIVETPAFEPKAIREEIDNLSLLHTAADLPATMTKVKELVQEIRKETPWLQRHEVYFLTDLQRTTWAPNSNEAAMTEFRRQTEELSQRAAMVVLDLGQPDVDNLAVTSLSAPDTVATVGGSVTVQAVLKDFGQRSHTKDAMEWFVDNRRVAAKEVDVPAGGETSATFTCRFETPGDHTVEVRTQGGALDVDNHRWLVVPVRSAIRVLVVNGRPSGERFRSAAFFLAAALKSGAGQPGHPAIESDIASESALLERELGGYDCVFLSNIAQFTPSEARVLDAYLGHGGNLVFFLGDQVDPDRYNRDLGSGAGGLRILPGRLGTVASGTSHTVDPLGYAHPLVRDFQGHEKAGLLGTLVSKYFRVEMLKDAKATVALALDNGSPLIVEAPVRRGRVLLVATSADTSWTNLPAAPSFLPIVRKMVTWLAGRQSQRRNVTAGEPLAASVAGQAADAPVVVVRPDGQAEQVQVHADGDYAGWTYDKTTTSGIYSVRYGRDSSASGDVLTFAVNVDTAESDLAQVSVDELRNDIWPGIRFSHQTTWQGPPPAADGPIASVGRLQVEILYVVLGILFLETLLAWRLGYHAT